MVSDSSFHSRIEKTTSRQSVTVCQYSGIGMPVINSGLYNKCQFFIGGGALLDAELQRFFYAIGIPMYLFYGEIAIHTALYMNSNSQLLQTDPLVSLPHRIAR